MIAVLGILTISITVAGHQVLHMPPVFGMMFGLGMLGTYGYFLKTRYPGKNKFDIFELTGKAEWDTLLFFYGILVCVGGLAAVGYLKLISDDMYVTLGATYANILVGFLSAIIDNIPIVYAVLTASFNGYGTMVINNAYSWCRWFVIIYWFCSRCSFNGSSKRVYTFFAHLRWSWAILIGYAASVACRGSMQIYSIWFL